MAKIFTLFIAMSFGAFVVIVGVLDDEGTVTSEQPPEEVSDPYGGIPVPLVYTGEDWQNPSTGSDQRPFPIFPELKEKETGDILKGFYAKTHARKLVSVYNQAARLGGRGLEGEQDPKVLFEKFIAGVQGHGELMFKFPPITEQEILAASGLLEFADGKLQTVPEAEFDALEEEIRRRGKDCIYGVCGGCVKGEEKVEGQNRLEVLIADMRKAQ